MSRFDQLENFPMNEVNAYLIKLPSRHILFFSDPLNISSRLRKKKITRATTAVHVHKLDSDWCETRQGSMNNAEIEKITIALVVTLRTLHFEMRLLRLRRFWLPVTVSGVLFLLRIMILIFLRDLSHSVFSLMAIQSLLWPPLGSFLDWSLYWNYPRAKSTYSDPGSADLSRIRYCSLVTLSYLHTMS